MSMTTRQYINKIRPTKSIRINCLDPIPSAVTSIFDRCAAGGDGSLKLAFLFDGQSKNVDISFVGHDTEREMFFLITFLVGFLLVGKKGDSPLSKSSGLDDSMSWTMPEHIFVAVTDECVELVDAGIYQGIYTTVELREC